MAGPTRLELATSCVTVQRILMTRNDSCGHKWPLLFEITAILARCSGQERTRKDRTCAACPRGVTSQSTSQKLMYGAAAEKFFAGCWPHFGRCSLAPAARPCLPMGVPGARREQSAWSPLCRMSTVRFSESSQPFRPKSSCAAQRLTGVPRRLPMGAHSLRRSSSHCPS
jgi:hypothetical protein